MAQVTKSLSIGIASDTHGSIDERIAQRMKLCDMVLHAGDIMSASVLDQIRPENGQLHAVRGNNDTRPNWAQGDQTRLDAIPDRIHLDLPGGRLSMIHGHQIWNQKDRNQALRDLFPDSKAIVYGHSHLRTYCDEKTPWLLNPGAAGWVRNHGGPSCMELHISDAVWHLSFLRFSVDISEKEPVIKNWLLEDACPA